MDVELITPFLNGINVTAYRLMKKAKANIKAIVKGMFGVGQEYYLFAKLS